MNPLNFETQLAEMAFAEPPLAVRFANRREDRFHVANVDRTTGLGNELKTQCDAHGALNEAIQELDVGLARG